MSYFEWVNLLQLVFIVGVLVICYRDENLRYLAILILLAHTAWYPLLKTLTDHSPPGYGWLYIVAASMANFITYYIILLRYYYSCLLRQRVMSLLNLLHINNHWIRLAVCTALPECYELRRYSQEFYLASTFKYISIFTILILLQYPAEKYLRICDLSLSQNCAAQFSNLKSNTNGILILLDELYLYVFGGNKYGIWFLYNDGYVFLQLVQLYVISMLVYQYLKGLFKFKSKLNI